MIPLAITGPCRSGLASRWAAQQPQGLCTDAYIAGAASQPIRPVRRPGKSAPTGSVYVLKVMQARWSFSREESYAVHGTGFAGVRGHARSHSQVALSKPNVLRSSRSCAALVN